MASNVPRRWVVNAFATRATSLVAANMGANAWTIVIPNEVYAIAIAPDSDVDIVELQPGGKESLDNRMMVSARRPWIGRIPAGTHLRAVPNRKAWLDGTAVFAPDEMPTQFGSSNQYSVMPRLILELYGKPEIDGHHGVWPNLPRGRAPISYHWADRAVASGATASFGAPTMGRHKLVLTLGSYSSGGSPTIAGTIYGIDSSANSTFTNEAITQLATFTQANFTGTGFYSFEYEGPPFEYIYTTIAVTVASLTWNQALHLHEDY